MTEDQVPGHVRAKRLDTFGYELQQLKSELTMHENTENGLVQYLQAVRNRT